MQSEHLLPVYPVLQEHCPLEVHDVDEDPGQLQPQAAKNVNVSYAISKLKCFNSNQYPLNNP